jgi:hypothetical protein
MSLSQAAIHGEYREQRERLNLDPFDRLAAGPASKTFIPLRIH